MTVVGYTLKMTNQTHLYKKSINEVLFPGMNLNFGHHVYPDSFHFIRRAKNI